MCGPSGGPIGCKDSRSLEVILMVGAYHLIVFCDINDDVVLKYSYGWSLALMIFVKLGVNIYFIGKSSYKEIKGTFLKYCCSSSRDDSQRTSKVKRAPEVTEIYSRSTII
jgi:hypothetical protein